MTLFELLYPSLQRTLNRAAQGTGMALPFLNSSLAEVAECNAAERTPMTPIDTNPMTYEMLQSILLDCLLYA